MSTSGNAEAAASTAASAGDGALPAAAPAAPPLTVDTALPAVAADAAAPLSEKQRIALLRSNKPGMCQIDGCERVVESVARKSLNWLASICLIPVDDEFADAGRKHHCRVCSRRVCTSHFVSAARKGDRKCTDCAGTASPGGSTPGGSSAAGHTADAESDSDD